MMHSKQEAPRFRPSFTLLELLVAISIIGIMAGMVLWSVMGAQNDARIARTRGTIQKLNDIVLQQWEEYRYKPVDVRIPAGWIVSPRERARIRMLVLRDTMRMEMPDRITDLLYLPSDYTVLHSAGVDKIPRAIPPRYGVLVDTLVNNIGGLSGFTLSATTDASGLPLASSNPLSAGVDRKLVTNRTDAEWTVQIESSELLYFIVATSQYAGSSALEFFRPSEVADTDDDGLLEFVDAWGEPIQWIRWPVGYPGDLVRYADDDAMDPAKTDWRYRSGVDPVWHPRTLVPLILSAGGDGQFGVTFDFNDASTPPIAYARMTWPAPAADTPDPPYGTVPNNLHYNAGTYYYVDPFYTDQRATPNDRNQIGSVPPAGVESATDNITNHDIILEP